MFGGRNSESTSLLTTPRPLPGYAPDPGKRSVTFSLAIGLVVSGLVSISPALVSISNHFQSEESLGVSRWVFLLLFTGLLQAAYAAYMAQLPDWSTVWVITIATLAGSALYATLLAVLLLASEDNQLLNLLQLREGQFFRKGSRRVGASSCYC